jgi:hypothetical protein
MNTTTPRLSFRIPTLVLLASCLGAGLAPTAQAIGVDNITLRKAAANATPMLADPKAAATALLAIKDEAELDKVLGGLAKAIHEKKAYKEAAAIYDALAARNTLRATLVGASLLLDVCEQIPQSAHALSKELLAFPDDLCERAAGLLKHPDPVVQAMGEWALALRVKKQDSSSARLDQQFNRGYSKAPWYAAWKARDTRTDLADDYVRQLVMLNRHRTLAGTAAAIEAADASLRRMLADPASKKPTAALSAYEALLTKARAHVATPGADLSRGHAGYLALRTMIRGLIQEARMEYPAEGFVFYTNPTLTGGTWNVNVPVVNSNNWPVGNLWVKRSAEPTVPATPLLPKEIGDGSVRGIDLAWEGDRVLFSFWHQPIDGKPPRGWSAEKNAAIYELALEGGGLKRVTNPEGYNDIQPVYLPDGSYVFVSDRSSYGNQCAGPILQNKRCTTLFRLDPKRSPEPYAISNNKDFDLHPHVLNDGTIAFTHWEYQERGLYSSHNVWRCRPDGTNMDAYYKQHLSSPFSMRDVRQAPDSETHIATIQGHHDGMNGPLVLVNPSLGINTAEAIWMLTPGCSEIEGGEGPASNQVVAGGGVQNRGGSYANPFPISDKVFLASGDLSRSESEFVVYYLDVWGNRELLHKDDDMSCYMPQALRARKRPPVIADTVKPDQTYATAFLEDVYRDLPGVEKGAVKFLRMSQSLMLPAPVYTAEEKAAAADNYNHLHYLPGDATMHHFGHWQWSPSRMIGLIKVEEDGSAFFKVPAGTPVYLQALDANLTEVRRMRTSFTLQRGEFRSCTGCHESRLETVGNRRPLPRLTLAQGPQTPVPAPWGETVLDFKKDIQPIFDASCVSCHGQTNPKGGLELTGREIGGFAQSYRAIFGLKPTDPTPVKELDWHLVLNPGAKNDRYITEKDAVKIFKAMQNNQWPGQLVSISDRMGDSAITQPNQFGSGQSKLIRTLLDDPLHRDQVRAKMTPEAWLALVTWVDYNAVYNGTLFDVSQFNKTKTFTRLPYDLPSAWIPADVNPTFHNKADNTAIPPTGSGR